MTAVADSSLAAAMPADEKLPAAERRKIVWSSVIGATVEWYDFLIYGTAAALVFNNVRCAHSQPNSSLVRSLSARRRLMRTPPSAKMKSWNKGKGSPYVTTMV